MILRVVTETGSIWDSIFACQSYWRFDGGAGGSVCAASTGHLNVEAVQGNHGQGTQVIHLAVGDELDAGTIHTHPVRPCAQVQRP